MAIDPTIDLGFRSPLATASATQPDPLEMVSLKTLMNRMQGGQSLGSMMATTAPVTAQPSSAAQSPTITLPWTPVSSVPANAAMPIPSTPAINPADLAGASLMMGVSRNGANVHSTDGGKTWLSSDSGNPVTGDVYQQTVVLGGQ